MPAPNPAGPRPGTSAPFPAEPSHLGEGGQCDGLCRTGCLRWELVRQSTASLARADTVRLARSEQTQTPNGCQQKAAAFGTAVSERKVAVGQQTPYKITIHQHLPARRTSGRNKKNPLSLFHERWHRQQRKAEEAQSKTPLHYRLCPKVSPQMKRHLQKVNRGTN